MQHCLNPIYLAEQLHVNETPSFFHSFDLLAIGEVHKQSDNEKTQKYLLEKRKSTSYSSSHFVFSPVIRCFVK